MHIYPNIEEAFADMFQSERQREHAAYLQTTTWKGKRQKVMQRARNVCEGCMENRATEVHHLTYAHWKDEFLYELVALCRDCHEKAHESPGSV